MYRFDEKNEFTVGNTKLSTPFRVTIPDYGYELTEINSSSPISIPSYFKAEYIVNWIERGLHVQFASVKEEEKLFFFLLEYNNYAKEYNASVGTTELPYTPVTLAYMSKQLKYKEVVETVEQNADNPFVRKNRGLQTPARTTRAIEYKRSSAIVDKFSKKKKAELVVESLKKPSEVRMYDVFSMVEEQVLPVSTALDDVALDN